MFKYQYDASGNLGYKQDLVNGVNYRYIYDCANRLAKVNESNGNSTSWSYDANNNINNISDRINGKIYDTEYTYNMDNQISTAWYERENYVTNIIYCHDTLGRLDYKNIYTGTASISTNYYYTPGINGSSTTKVSSIDNNGNGINYTYDQNGNIKTITQNGQVISYTYNELNELIREDNQVLGKSITYAYDAGGNITSKTEYAYTTGALGTATAAHSYTYGNTNWKDELTAYDGNTITYDAIGNPLTFYGWTYTWEQGRQLAGLRNSANNITYKYNDSGIRTSKVVNGVKTNYQLVGDKVTYEDNGTDKIYYTYDSIGKLVSMNLNGVEYYYIRNAQEDIIGLIDKNGNQVVTYTYDSWGKLISITGTLASTV